MATSSVTWSRLRGRTRRPAQLLELLRRCPRSPCSEQKYDTTDRPGPLKRSGGRPTQLLAKAGTTIDGFDERGLQHCSGQVGSRRLVEHGSSAQVALDRGGSRTRASNRPSELVGSDDGWTWPAGHEWCVPSWRRPDRRRLSLSAPFGQSTWRSTAAQAPACWRCCWPTTSSPRPSSRTSTSAVWRDAPQPRRCLGGRRSIARRVRVLHGHLLGSGRQPGPPSVRASCATQRPAGPAQSSSCPSEFRSPVVRTAGANDYSQVTHLPCRTEACPARGRCNTRRKVTRNARATPPPTPDERSGVGGPPALRECAVSPRFCRSSGVPSGHPVEARQRSVGEWLA